MNHYYIAYDKDNGNKLLALSENPITPVSASVVVIQRNGDMPNLAEVEWNPANLFFYKDGDIVIG